MGDHRAWESEYASIFATQGPYAVQRDAQNGEDETAGEFVDPLEKLDQELRLLDAKPKVPSSDGYPTQHVSF
jgi:hypothetical protein